MANTTDIEASARAMAQSYAALFAKPACSTPGATEAVADEIGGYYRPGVTFFTRGVISRFETQKEASKLIANEMNKNITLGLGTHLSLVEISKVEVYSSTSALLWLKWTFTPMAGSEFEGNGWTFTNIYGYRAAGVGAEHSGEAGWEFVVRDEEVNEMIKVTGNTFLET